MNPHHSDRNLLFGILALQLDFIGRDALVSALRAWIAAKHRPLGDLLVEKGDLSSARRSLLETLVEEHLAQHGDDTARSLAALTPAGLTDSLRQLDDADLQQSLAHLTILPTADGGSTRGWARRHGAVVAGLSALVLAVLVLGIGSWAWWQSRQALEEAARDDLTQAEEMLREDKPAAEILQIVERAEARLVGGGAERLRERARQLRAWVALADQLELARQQMVMAAKEGLDFASGDRVYAETFAEHGLDGAALPPQEVAQRICSTPIRTHLVAALDDWAEIKDRLQADSGEPLRVVARLADDDDWRRTLRDPAVRKDRVKLESLAKRDDTFTQPPANLVLLARALQTVGGTAAAERLLRQAQQQYPADFWINIYLASMLQKEPETRSDAIQCYFAALALRPSNEVTYNDLGVILADRGSMWEAEKVYRQALYLKPDYAQAYCNLGLLLRQQGEFAEALTALQRGHELGSKTPGWRYPSAQWVRETKTLADLDARLTTILRGDVQPVSAAERIQLAFFCQQNKQLPVAAVRFYADAFAEQPKLADDLSQSHRYNAACAAALAGCGQGKDAGKLDEKERARLRQQALDWLRADLTAWGQRLDKEADKARADVVARMTHWQQDTDFAGVRGDALDRLPQSERPPWRKLWDDVQSLRRRAAGQQ